MDDWQLEELTNIKGIGDKSVKDIEVVLAENEIVGDLNGFLNVLYDGFLEDVLRSDQIEILKEEYPHEMLEKHDEDTKTTEEVTNDEDTEEYKKESEEVPGTYEERLLKDVKEFYDDIKKYINTQDAHARGLRIKIDLPRMLIISQHTQANEVVTFRDLKSNFEKPSFVELFVRKIPQHEERFRNTR